MSTGVFHKCSFLCHTLLSAIFFFFRSFFIFSCWASLPWHPDMVHPRAEDPWGCPAPTWSCSKSISPARCFNPFGPFFFRIYFQRGARTTENIMVTFVSLVNLTKNNESNSFSGVQENYPDFMILKVAI